MKILITGAAGFLGTNLAISLNSLGHEIDGIDLNNPQVRYVFKNFYINDICKHNFSGQYDLIFHFASLASPPIYKKQPRLVIETNTLGLYRLIDAFPNSRIIFASTSEIYGNPLISPQSEAYYGNTNCFGERSCYDEAKRCGEAIMFSSKAGGIVRIFNTYGPYMNLSDGRVINSFMLSALNKKPYLIKGSGKQKRSFCYVSDLINGIINYAFSGCITPVNIGNNEEISIIDLAKIFNLVLNLDLPIEFTSSEDKDDPEHRCPDLSKAFEYFNYKPMVSIEEGLKLFYKFLT